MNRLIVAVLALLLVSARPPVAAAQEDPTLQAIWEGQQSEIVTARLKYRRIGTGGGYSTRLPYEDVMQIVEEADLARHPDALKQVIDQLQTIVSIEKPWLEFEFLGEGDNALESGPWGIHAFDGAQEIRTDAANNQATLYAPGTDPVKRTRLAEFRFVPALPEPLPRLEIAASDTGEVSLSGEGFEIVADGATGFVHAFVRRGGDGTVLSALHQYNPVEHPGGIVFPTVIVDSDYQAGRMNHVTITIVEEARFNEDLPDDAFAVPVPAELVLFDHRGNRDAPSLARTLDETPSVASFADEKVRAAVAAAAEQDRFPWFMVIVGTLVALIAASACRRYFRNKNSRV